MPNQIIHYIGENPSIYTSSMDGITLTKMGAGNQSRIEVSTDVSRFGDSSIHVGYIDPADASNYYRKQTYLFNLYPENDLSPIGNEDYTIAFWWKPTAETYYDYPFKTLFSSGGGKVINDGIIGGMDQTDFNLTYQAPADNVSGYEELSFGLDLTGNPWIHIYASRIGDTFSFIISDVNGNIFSDKDGNGCSTVYALPNNQKKNITTTTLAIGGGAGTSGIGYYDDILHLKGEGIAYNTLDLTQPLSISGEPFVTAVVSDASAGQSDGSVTVTDSNFSGTKTYTFYDSNLNILQQGVSNTLNGLQASSYTIQVSDTNGNQVSTIFAISEGGNNMAYININSDSGLVVQKKMVRDSGEMAAVLMVAEPESGLDKNGNEAFAEAQVARGVVTTALTAEATARAADLAATTAAREAGDSAVTAEITAEQASQDSGKDSLVAELAADFAEGSDAIVAETAARVAAIAAELAAEVAQDGVITGEVAAQEASRSTDVASLATTRGLGDDAVEVLVAAEEAAEDAAYVAENAARVAADAAMDAFITLKLVTGAQDDMVEEMSDARIAGDAVVAAELATEVAAEAAAEAAEVAARSVADVALDDHLAVAVAARETMMASAQTARANADSALGVLVDSLIATREGDITAEEAAHAAADTAAGAAIAAEATARAADMVVAVAYRSDNQLLANNAIVAETAAREIAVDDAAADALASDTTLAATISSYSTAEAAAWAAHGVARSDADDVLSASLAASDLVLSNALTTEGTAQAAADNAVMGLVNTQAAKRAADLGGRGAEMAELEAKFKFTGDAANGGDLVLEETGGLKVTATFVKINATLTKMFLS